MKNIRAKSILSLILNIATFLLTAAAVGWFFTAEGLEDGMGNMQTGGTGCFIFFTNDSNILAALCSLLMIPFQIRTRKSGKVEIPVWVSVLKLVGTTAVTVTLMVVLLFLGPIMGYKLMFEGNCLALHLLCPLLAIVSLCFFDGGTAFSKKQALWGILPTFLYGTVYLIMVIFTKTWTDFYHFNIGGCWYITYVVMPAITYLFALALRAIHNKTTQKITVQA